MFEGTEGRVNATIARLREKRESISILVHHLQDYLLASSDFSFDTSFISITLITEAFVLTT